MSRLEERAQVRDRATALRPAGGPGRAEPGGAGSHAHRAERPRTATGTWQLLRFSLRRDRIRLPVWIAGAATLVGIQSVSSQSVYDTPEALAAYQQMAGANAAVVAMTGRAVGLTTVERAVAFEIFTTTAVVVGLMSVFTVVRHTRADEEAGRAELVRATRVGRRAPLLAALALVSLACLAVLVAVGGVGVGTGLPVEGSLLLGTSLGAFGLVMGALTAVAAQLSSHSRTAASLGGTAVGVAFALRALGDVREDWVSWLSPMGWAQATYPFALDRWWPLLLCLGAGAGLAVLAVRLLDRRDHDAGLIQPRPGRERASRGLGGPLGLAWRLQRGSVIGWTVGIVAAGLAYGSLVQVTVDLVDATPGLADMIPGGSGSVVDSFVYVMVAVLALLAASAGLAGSLRAHAEETAGRAEPVLAASVSRYRLAGSHALVGLTTATVSLLLGGSGMGLLAVVTGSERGIVADMLLAVAVVLPAVWVLVALGTLLSGVSARLSWVAWLGLGWSTVVLMLGDSLDLPGWLRDSSPLEHVPMVPLEDARWGPPLVLLAVAVGVLVAGLLAWRRRDLATA